MPRNPARNIDKTCLSADKADDRLIIHRDLIAHSLRWSHVVRVLHRDHLYKRAYVLDVGCGREVPLAKCLYTNRLAPKRYVGVDYGPINTAKSDAWPADFYTKPWLDLRARTSVLDVNPKSLFFTGGGQDLPNVVVSFEVMEHVTPALCRSILIHLQTIVSPDAVFFISTPCWDRVRHADNHINEMTYHAFGALLEDLGYMIEDHFGTFASIKDYEHHLTSELKVPAPVFQRLRDYYDTNLLSILFAPLVPSMSRNVIWRLGLGSGSTGVKRRFAPLAEQERPWSHHPNWVDLLGRDEPKHPIAKKPSSSKKKKPSPVPPPPADADEPEDEDDSPVTFSRKGRA